MHFSLEGNFIPIVCISLLKETSYQLCAFLFWRKLHISSLDFSFERNFLAVVCISLIKETSYQLGAFLFWRKLHISSVHFAYRGNFISVVLFLFWRKLHISCMHFACEGNFTSVVCISLIKETSHQLCAFLFLKKYHNFQEKLTRKYLENYFFRDENRLRFSSLYDKYF